MTYHKISKMPARAGRFSFVHKLYIAEVIKTRRDTKSIMEMDPVQLAQFLTLKRRK